jgi:choline dehydrogenase-like flavoprotein
MDSSPDVIIIGSGIGGATIARGLAASGARILILERGQQLIDTPETRDDRAIFQRGHFRSPEMWVDSDGRPFSPGTFYNVGGNSKFYGAVMYRYRREDFEAREHRGGVSPGWPITYSDLEPWYGKAEWLFQVRGESAKDPTEPPHSTGYAYPPVPNEPFIAAVADRLEALGLHPSPLPLAVNHRQWLDRAKTPWDGFPDTRTGKIDAETGPLAEALTNPNVSLMQNARVVRLELDSKGRRVRRLVLQREGQECRLQAKVVVLAAGAVNSAALLLRSATAFAPSGVANRSDQVGRNFMNHNCTAMLAIDPRLRNTAIYQKTFGLNDFYLNDGKGGYPLGNVQLLGKISGPILKANLPAVPEFVLRRMAHHSVDWYLMSEDLPNPLSRVRVDGTQIKLDWQRSNLEAHSDLRRRMKDVLRAAHFPIVLSKPFDKRSPSHQCGTAVMGRDPATSVVDVWCRSHDHENLFVVDASVLPTSAAVNPALTIAALALRAAEHIATADLGSQAARPRIRTGLGETK